MGRKRLFRLKEILKENWDFPALSEAQEKRKDWRQMRMKKYLPSIFRQVCISDNGVNGVEKSDGNLYQTLEPNEQENRSKSLLAQFGGKKI